MRVGRGVVAALFANAYKIREDDVLLAQWLRASNIFRQLC